MADPAENIVNFPKAQREEAQASPSMAPQTAPLMGPPHPLSNTSQVPTVLPTQLQGLDPTAHDLVAFAYQCALGLINNQMQGMLSQQQRQFQEQFDRLEGLVDRVKGERDSLRHSAEKMMEMITEVQQGNKQANAVIFRSPNCTEGEPLACVTVEGKEYAYTMFSAEVANAVGVDKSLLKKVAIAAGVWDNPDYHATIQTSAKGSVQKYKPRAIERLREFLDDPANHRVTPNHPNWSFIKHYLKRKRENQVTSEHSVTPDQPIRPLGKLSLF